MKRRDGRRVSAGTVVVLVMACLSIAATALIWLRLSSGRQPDRTRQQASAADIREPGTEEWRGTPPPSAVPDSSGDRNGSGAAGDSAPGTEIPAAQEYSFTLTAAGTVAVEGEVRKNSWLSDLKIYDLTDIMMLLKNEMRSDLNIAFLENLISDDLKVSDTVMTGNEADMLKAGGFNMAACGFSKAWAGEEAGITDTRMNLLERGIKPAGILDEPGQDAVTVSELHGVRYTVLQYTDTIASGTRKTMNKKGLSGMVPDADPEKIAADITMARSRGAQAVIVLISWGKVGKAPDKEQKARAQAIADAGADLIIGSGSRIPQGIDILAAVRADGTTADVPCVWSLGTVLSAERGNARRVAGYLFHVTLAVNRAGHTECRSMEYTPIYTWKYKQDGRYYYRCIPSNRDTPDGMDGDQTKFMKKAADAVLEVMKGAPAAER